MVKIVTPTGQNFQWLGLKLSKSSGSQFSQILVCCVIDYSLYVNVNYEEGSDVFHQPLQDSGLMIRISSTFHSFCIWLAISRIYNKITFSIQLMVLQQAHVLIVFLQ